MNKAELTAAIVKKTGFTKKDAEKAIAALTEVVTETLAAGEKVQIVGFGTFEVKERAERNGRKTVILRVYEKTYGFNKEFQHYNSGCTKHLLLFILMIDSKRKHP